MTLLYTKCSILLSGRTNLPQFLFLNWLFLLIFQMNFRIMPSSYRKKKSHLGLWKELDSTYILIHEPFASLYYAVLPFGKMTCSGSLFLSFVFAGLTLWSKWNFSEYCEMRIKIDSFSNSQFFQIPVFV